MLQPWEPPDQGVLFVVSGASGTGKSTLIEQVFAEVPGLEFSVSATTRAPRPGEVNGREYHFLDREHFRELLAKNALLEHAEVYGNFYGTLRDQVMEALAAGRSIVLDIDSQGAEQVRKAMPEAVSIFILPPDLVALRARLEARGKDSPETIERRVREAKAQLGACGDYDYLVMNDDLATASASIRGIFVAELLRRKRRESWVRRIQAQIA